MQRISWGGVCIPWRWNELTFRLFFLQNVQVFSESIKEERRLGHEAYITIRKGRILQIAGGWAESVWRTGNCSLSGRAAQWCQSHCKSLSDCRWRRIYAGLYRGREWAYSPCGFRFCNRWSAVVSHEYSVHTGISSRPAVSPYSCFGRKKFPGAADCRNDSSTSNIK